MTQSKAKKVLIDSFGALKKRHLRNMAWHLKNKTKIACGEERWNIYCRNGYA